MSGFILPPDAEVARVLQHTAAVEQILAQDKPEDERTDEADKYMARVLELSGQRVYDGVLTMIAAAREIPPKDIRR